MLMSVSNWLTKDEEWMKVDTVDRCSDVSRWVSQTAEVHDKNETALSSPSLTVGTASTCNVLL